MPSKKRRIQSLEVDSQGLCDRLDYAENTIRELETKIAELEKRVGNAWLIPTSKTINIPSVWSSSGYCPVCLQWYWGSHVCSGNPIKVTWGTSTITTNTSKKEGV